MALENGPFEDVCSIKNVDIPFAMLVYQSVSQMTNIYNLYNSRIDSLVMICEPFNKPNGSKWVIWVMF